MHAKTLEQLLTPKHSINAFFQLCWYKNFRFHKILKQTNQQQPKTHTETATTNAQKLFPKTFCLDYTNFPFSIPEC